MSIIGMPTNSMNGGHSMPFSVRPCTSGLLLLTFPSYDVCSTKIGRQHAAPQLLPNGTLHYEENPSWDDGSPERAYITQANLEREERP